MMVRIRGGIEAEVIETNPTGYVVVPQGGSSRLVVPWEQDVIVANAAVRLRRPGDPAPEIAMAALREWRSATAARDKVPAYVVFSDAHLEGIASAMPKTLNELANCRGIGPAKLEKYGDELLAILESVGAAPRG
jgi:superfamily II DNA helicase RecQ